MPTTVPTPVPTIVPVPLLTRKNARVHAHVPEEVEDKHLEVLDQAADFSLEAKRYSGSGGSNSAGAGAGAGAGDGRGSLGRLPVASIEVDESEFRASLEEFDARQLDAFGR